MNNFVSPKLSFLPLLKGPSTDQKMQLAHLFLALITLVALTCQQTDSRPTEADVEDGSGGGGHGLLQGLSVCADGKVRRQCPVCICKYFGDGKKECVC